MLIPKPFVSGRVERQQGIKATRKNGPGFKSGKNGIGDSETNHDSRKVSIPILFKYDLKFSRR
jgi:hypothetical protein